NNETTASAYERQLLPLIFNPWGKVLIDKAGLKAGDRVLDVATGPGTLARLAAQHCGPAGHVSGVDSSPQMLALARDKAPLPDAARLDYLEAQADGLPFPNAAFDVVLCQQGLQFFPDQLAALKEMRRVLKPGGRAALSMWTGIKAMTLFSTFLDAVDACLAKPAPRAALGWLDSQALASLLERAGFEGIQVREEVLVAEFEQGLAQALACVDGTTAGAPVRAMTPQARLAFERRVAFTLAPFEEDGVLKLPARAWVASARA
ncbi:MAG TPA: class I SAM-dependent methyltransferase, partial [bacterium]|nr:class I SAM-dependent methyltransferase [bacterium]